MKTFGMFLVSIGGVLLLTATVGFFLTGAGNASTKEREWEMFDKTLAENVRSWASLRLESEKRLNSSTEMSDQERMRILYELVAERFTHGQARHTALSNWLLWALSYIDRSLGQIRVPDTMLKRSNSLICGQSSYILLRLALEHGIRARHVGLNGHVVMEAWYGNEWHLYDPDLEVLPKDDAGHVLSVEELSRGPEWLRHYYGGHRGNEQSMVKIVGSRYDNTYMSYPPGAWFEWKSNVLFYFEKWAQWLKIAIPTLLVLGGIFCMGGRRHPKEAPSGDAN